MFLLAFILNLVINIKSLLKWKAHTTKKWLELSTAVTVADIGKVLVAGLAITKFVAIATLKCIPQILKAKNPKKLILARGQKCHTGKSSVENAKNLDIVVLEKAYQIYMRKTLRTPTKKTAKDF